jgi:hypothetical protein
LETRLRGAAKRARGLLANLNLLCGAFRCAVVLGAHHLPTILATQPRTPAAAGAQARANRRAPAPSPIRHTPQRPGRAAVPQPPPSRACSAQSVTTGGAAPAGQANWLSVEDPGVLRGWLGVGRRFPASARARWARQGTAGSRGGDVAGRGERAPSHAWLRPSLPRAICPFVRRPRAHLAQLPVVGL